MKVGFKKLVEQFRYRNVAQSWKRRHAKVFQAHPYLSEKIDPGIWQAHLDYWKPLGKSFSPETLQICHHLSGVQDHRIVPEELYQGYIEPKLNHTAVSDFFAHKSFYHHWHGRGIFAECYFHKINGDYFDDNFQPIALHAIVQRLKDMKGEHILKPNFGSYGGKDIRVIHSETPDLEGMLRSYPNFVVQEKVRQHDSLAAFHPQSLNTVRAHLYRRVGDGEMVFLHAALRMGRNGSLDNLSDGGLVSFIREDGKLHGHALDKYGDRLEVHPNSGKSFDMTLPDYDELKGVALKVARKIFYTRVIGLDMCYDADGKWRVIEVNTQAQSIRFAQYAGIPFFGNYTDEVKNMAGCLV